MNAQGAAVVNEAEKVRGHRPLLALVWKEWRQQRLVFLVLAPLAPILLLLSAGEWAWVTAGAAGLACGAVALLLSVNAFTADVEERSLEFVETLPLSRTRIFWVKIAVTCVLLCAALAIAAPMYATFAREFPIPAIGAKYLFLLVPLSCLVLLLVPPMVSAFPRSAMAVTLVSVIVSAVIIWLGGFFGLGFSLRDVRQELTLLVGRFLWYSGIVIAAMVLAAYVFWCRIALMSFRKRLLATTGVAVALLFVAVAPLLWVWARLVYLEEPADSVRRGDFMWVHRGLASRSGRFLMYRQLPNERGWRVAVLDADEGCAFWIDRCRMGFSDNDPWSPDGKRCLVAIQRLRISPLELLFWKMVRREAFDSDRFVVDATTRTMRRLDSLVPDMADVTGRGRLWYRWLDNETVAVCGKQGVCFADLRSGTMSRCDWPEEHHIKCRQFSRWNTFVTARGLVTSQRRVTHPYTVGGWGILRFAPDIATAEELRLPPDWENMDTRAVSKNGKWAIVVEPIASATIQDKLWHVLSLENGERRLLSGPESRSGEAAIGPDWYAHGFTADSGHVVLSRGIEIGRVKIPSMEFSRVEVQSEPLRESWRRRRRNSYWIPLHNAQPDPSGDRLLVIVSTRKRHGLKRSYQQIVVDTLTGSSSLVWDSQRDIRVWLCWLGPDRLLGTDFRDKTIIWVVNADGTGKRRLLLKKSPGVKAAERRKKKDMP